MPECAKTHLQQSRISKFSGGGPPSSRGGEGRGREGRRGRGKGREGGRGRIGKGGMGRDTGGKEGGRGGMGGGGEGRGGALDMGFAPLETSSGSAPASQKHLGRLAPIPNHRPNHS